nr:unnamed protein product [Callosobruchus analis]
MVSGWYKCLDRFGKYIKDKSSTSVALKKVFLDQAVFAPCSLAVVMTILNFLEGGNFKSAKEEIKEKYVDILATNYKIWPAVQMVNFYFLPLKYQVLLAQSVGLLWNSYLSWKIHN